MNEYIAVKFMGYRVARAVGASKKHYFREDDDFVLYSLPNFSGSIATVWPVVEELARQGCQFDIECRSAGRDWYAIFAKTVINSDGDCVEIKGDSDWCKTAALAIGHAARDICEKMKVSKP